MSYHLKMNLAWCKSCKICVDACPKDVLTMGEDNLVKVVNMEACIGCKMCEYKCPDFVIQVEEV